MTDAPKTFQYCGIINSGSSHLQIQVEIFQDCQYLSTLRIDSYFENLDKKVNPTEWMDCALRRKSPGSWRPVLIQMFQMSWGRRPFSRLDTEKVAVTSDIFQMRYTAVI